MPKLFPESAYENLESQESKIDESVEFGRSWKFNFEKGDFEETPTGKIRGTDPLEAWVEWCKKSISTERYKYLAYTNDHGQEFTELIRRNLSRSANESEIKRMVTECLMVNLRTERVDNFSFVWDGDEVFFYCDIHNTLGESARIDGSVVISG